jgi:hypothetical protein
MTITDNRNDEILFNSARWWESAVCLQFVVTTELWFSPPRMPTTTVLTAIEEFRVKTVCAREKFQKL